MEHGFAVDISNALVDLTCVVIAMLADQEFRRFRDEEENREEENDSEDEVEPVDDPVALTELVGEREPCIAGAIEAIGQSAEDCSEIGGDDLDEQ